MSATHRRAARREQQVAVIVGGERVRFRPRYMPAPDLQPMRLPSGDVLQLEVKSTKRPPKLITRAIEQAKRYTPSAIGVAVVAPFGGRAIACLDLLELARLLGLRAPEVGQQLALIGGSR